MPDSDDWYYLVDHQQYGPISLDALKGHIAAEQLPADTWVSQLGMEGWEPAHALPSFMTNTPAPIVKRGELGITEEKNSHVDAITFPVVFIQKHPMHGKVKFVLSKETLEIISDGIVFDRKVKVPVSSLGQRPVRIERSHIGWYFGAILFTGYGAALGGAGVFQPISAIIGIHFLVIALVLVIYMRVGLEKILVFKTSNHSVTFWIDNPRKVAFEKFVRTLLMVINSESTAQDMSPGIPDRIQPPIKFCYHPNNKFLLATLFFLFTFICVGVMAALHVKGNVVWEALNSPPVKAMLWLASGSSGILALYFITWYFSAIGQLHYLELTNTELRFPPHAFSNKVYAIPYSAITNLTERVWTQFSNKNAKIRGLSVRYLGRDYLINPSLLPDDSVYEEVKAFLIRRLSSWPQE